MNLVPSPDSLSGDGKQESAGAVSALRRTILGSSILVVDDQRIVRELLKVYLNAGGYDNLIFAADGDEALEIIGTETLDLVVLDLQMPTIGGLEVCETVRRDPQMAYLPILVQTAADSPEDRARIFAAGATDMVGKPINDAELLACVGIHLQNRHMLRQLSRYRESMERELEAARRMQHDMMPPASMVEQHEQTYPIRIRHHFQTCDELGGDIWNLWPVSESRLGFAIVDFTGHGVSASLNTFRFQSLSLSLGREIEECGLQETVERLGNELSELLPIGQFATAIIGEIDFHADAIRYAAAGGPSPFLKRPEEYGDIFCPSQGRPLGMVRGSEYPVTELPFPPGSSVFLYSDALTETPSMVDPVYDEDRISDVLTGRAGIDAETPFDGLVQDFFGRLDAPLNDDLTLVQFERLPEEAG